MFYVLLGIIAAVILFLIGYITISCYIKKSKINLAEKVVFSLFSFFIVPYVFYILNLIFNGNILSNRAIFYSFFILYIFIHLIFAFKNVKNDILEIKRKIFNLEYWTIKRILYLISIFIVIIYCGYISIRPLLISPLLVGDYLFHIMYSRQFLNGFTQSHLPYQGFSSTYPFLVHTSIAFIKQLFNIHIFDAYYVLVFFHSFLLPSVIIRLGNKIFKKYWATLLLLIFVVLNGGLEFVGRESWYYNTAMQISAVSHLPRQIIVGFFPLFLYLMFKLDEESKNSFFIIFSGIILGLSGVTHGNIFFYLVLLVIITILMNFKDKVSVKNFIYILIFAFLITAPFYLPLLYSMFIQKSINLAVQKGNTSILTIERFLTQYSIIGIIAIFSFNSINKMRFKKIWVNIFIALLIIFIVTTFAFLLIKDRDPTWPWRQHRYGPIFCIVLSIFSVFFIYRLVIHKDALIKSILVFLIILFVFISIKNVLDQSNWRCELCFNSRNDAQILRDKDNIVNVVLREANKNDIILAPSSVSNLIPYYVGLDSAFVGDEILYVSQSDYPSFQTYREREVNLIYQEKIKKDDLKKFLIKTNTSLLLTFEEDKQKFDSVEFLEYCCKGKWINNKDLLVYKVKF